MCLAELFQNWRWIKEIEEFLLMQVGRCFIDNINWPRIEWHEVCLGS